MINRLRDWLGLYRPCRRTHLGPFWTEPAGDSYCLACGTQVT